MPGNDERSTPDEQATLNLSAEERESLWKLISAGKDFYRTGRDAYGHDEVDVLIDDGNSIMEKLR